MKKTVLSFIVGSTLVFSTSAFGLSLMTEAQMRAAYAQAGIDIAIDYILFEQTIKSISYTDTDGTEGNPASVVIKDQHFVKEYRGVISSDDYNAKFTEATNGTAPTAPWTKYSPISINVGTCPVLSVINGTPITGIVAGLPTLIVNTKTEEFSIGVSMAGAFNDGKNFIDVQIKTNVMAILGGTIEIAAH